MKQHLNTLFITLDDAYLAKQGEAVLVRHEKQTKLRVPIHTLGGTVCFGRIGISPSLMHLCGERGVAISLLAATGRFLARIDGFASGNVLLRREQYRRADSQPDSASIARVMVAAKIANARQTILRCLRDYPQNPGGGSLQTAASQLADSATLVQSKDSLDVIRGMEGDAARVYFDVFDHLIVAQKPAFEFRSRSEFRSFLADRLALSLINRRQVGADGFERTASDAIQMNDATRKAVLVAYQKRKQEEITHPFLNERVSVGLLVHLQARLLARHLRGDMDAYPAFLWK